MAAATSSYRARGPRPKIKKIPNRAPKPRTIGGKSEAGKPIRDPNMNMPLKKRAKLTKRGWDFDEDTGKWYPPGHPNNRRDKAQLS